MGTNWGLLNTMASGIKEAMTAYQTKQNSDRQERQFNILNGVQGYDESNQPIFTPEAQRKRDLQNQLLEAQVQKAQGLDEDTKINAARYGLIKTEDGYQKTPEQLQREKDQQIYKEEMLKGLLSTNKKKADEARITPEKKPILEDFSKTIAKYSTIKSQVDELKKQVSDPSISERDRIATANEQLKLLNSTLGSDAVGAEEANRLAAFLDQKPNMIKGFKFGPDLDAFTRQLDRISQRTSGTMKTTDSNIKKITGRSTGLIDSSESSGFPKKIKKNGKIATVSSQAELDEARKEGWQ